MSRHHYREALRRQPDLVDAHRGYWWKNDEPTDKIAMVDRIYMLVSRAPLLPTKLKVVVLDPVLRWHHRRHPEDSRIHFMLGANALLRRDYEMAEERLEFANELLEGNDLEATARLALVWAATGRIEDMKEAIRNLHDASKPDGTKPKIEELGMRVGDLYKPIDEIPNVVPPEGRDALDPYVEDIFREVAAHFDQASSGPADS